MSEAQAARMQVGAEAILAALSKAGLEEDGTAMVAALAAALGCIAANTPDPAATLAAAVRVAEGIISGELLDLA